METIVLEAFRETFGSRAELVKNLNVLEFMKKCCKVYLNAYNQLNVVESENLASIDIVFDPCEGNSLSLNFLFWSNDILLCIMRKPIRKKQTPIINIL